MSDPAMEQNGPLRRRFATTRWSLVAVASLDVPDTTTQREALVGLCTTYWFPVYAFVRWQGYSQSDAEDLIQGFFARLIEKNDLADADPARGRFRTFLLASLQHYMANERDHQQALKRGGGVRIISIDVPAAEARLGNAPSHKKTPEREFDRQWALSVLEHAMSDLRVEYEGAVAASCSRSCRRFWLVLPTKRHLMRRPPSGPICRRGPSRWRCIGCDPNTAMR